MFVLKLYAEYDGRIITLQIQLTSLKITVFDDFSSHSLLTEKLEFIRVKLSSKLVSVFFTAEEFFWVLIFFWANERLFVSAEEGKWEWNQGLVVCLTYRFISMPNLTHIDHGFFPKGKVWIYCFCNLWTFFFTDKVISKVFDMPSVFCVKFWRKNMCCGA